MPKSKGATTITMSDYTSIGKKLGSNEGGFYKHNATGKEYYIKWLPEDLLEDEKKYFPAGSLDKGKYKNRHRNRFNNEILALRLYELYGVSVPKAEFITYVDDNGKRFYGIASEKKADIEMVGEAFNKEFSAINRDVIIKKAQEDFLLDILLSNYDVVGLAMDNMHYETKGEKMFTPFRLDPGGALRYFAQGGPKKDQFNSQVPEFEMMESGNVGETKFNPKVIKVASKVFKGVHDSPALLIGLRKLLSVSDEQLQNCVAENGFDTGEPGNKGGKKNEAIIQQLLERKQELIKKAEEKIINRLVDGLKDTVQRGNYLKEAGLEDGDINKICYAISENEDKSVIQQLIRAAISPKVEPKYTLPKTGEAIDLDEYEKVKDLTNGLNFDVHLWQHKQDPNLKIVVKTEAPKGSNKDKKQGLVEHNIKTINTFFGGGAAWHVKGSPAFAMKYFEGKPLSQSEAQTALNLKTSLHVTVSKEGELFTLLDPNKNNYIQLADGQIVPIDFDYMIMHDKQPLLPYQREYLDGRMGFALRMGSDSGITEAEAVVFVLKSYPKAYDYFLEQWGTEKLQQAAKKIETLYQSEQKAKAPAPLVMNDQIAANAQALYESNGLQRVRVVPRVEVYKENDAEHNAKQPLKSIQFAFQSAADRDQFVKHIKTLSKDNVIVYVGTGRGDGKPIVQLKPGFVASYNPVLAQTSAMSSQPEFIQEVLSELNSILPQVKVLKLEAASAWLRDHPKITDIQMNVVLAFIRDVCAMKNSSVTLFSANHLPEFNKAMSDKASLIPPEQYKEINFSSKELSNVIAANDYLEDLFSNKTAGAGGALNF